MSIKEQIENLRSELHKHNYNYYVLDDPTPRALEEQEETSPPPT